MTRVIVAEGCREIDSPSGRRYYARDYRQGGSFDMTPADAKTAVRMGGAVASLAGATRRAVGFRCPACGFGAFTRTCGRCGSECQRDNLLSRRPRCRRPRRGDRAGGDQPAGTGTGAAARLPGAHEGRGALQGHPGRRRVLRGPQAEGGR